MIHIIEQSGSVALNRANDTQTQLYTAIQSMTTTYYDYVVSSQYTFNNLVERVAANQYKIKDAYKSVFFKNLSGGYAMAGALSPLSGGDSWGYLETNNCTTLHAEAGSFIYFEDTQGYIEVNTDDCTLKDIYVKGLGSSAAAITQSFLLNAHRVKYDNCKTSDRLSNTTFYGFKGSGTTLHNMTSKYISCSGYTLDSSGSIYPYYQCYNLSNCIAYDIDGTHVNGGVAFEQCYNLSNCIAYDIDGTAGTMRGYRTCYNLSSCIAEDIQSATNVEAYKTCYNLSSCFAKQIDATSTLYGYNGCEQISSCFAEDLDGATVYGFYSCTGLTSSRAYDIEGTSTTTAFKGCNQVTSCIAYTIESTGANARGYDDCLRVSACLATSITGNADAWGFDDSTDISACNATSITATTGDAFGFDDCEEISACSAQTITAGAGTASGFNNCTYASSIWTNEAVNANNDWADTNDAQITNGYSCPAVFT